MIKRMDMVRVVNIDLNWSNEQKKKTLFKVGKVLSIYNDNKADFYHVVFAVQNGIATFVYNAEHLVGLDEINDPTLVSLFKILDIVDDKELSQYGFPTNEEYEKLLAIRSITCDAIAFLLKRDN